MSTFGFETEGLEVVGAFKNRVEGKTIVITGTSANGLGAATAIALAHGKPASIFLLARSTTKVQPVIDSIASVDSSVKTTFIPIELDNFDSVRQAASTIISSTSKVDYLINNAGIMAVKTFTTNSNGIESHLATNHCGHFLLTALLLPLLLSSTRSTPGTTRIVNLTSDGYTICPFNFASQTFASGKDYNMWAGYGQSKTANILFTAGLASRLHSKQIPIQTFAVHPGVIISTSLSDHLDPSEFGGLNDAALKYSGEPFKMGEFKSEAQGISTTLVAALDPRLEGASGSYMEDCQVKPAREYATNEDNAERLWQLTEEWVGEKFEI